VKLGYFADWPWSHRALDAMLADGQFDVAFMALRHGRPDPVLPAAAVNCPHFVVSDVNNPGFVGYLGDGRIEQDLPLPAIGARFTVEPQRA